MVDINGRHVRHCEIRSVSEIRQKDRYYGNVHLPLTAPCDPALRPLVP
jgi:hypothetical protein